MFINPATALRILGSRDTVAELANVTTGKLASGALCYVLETLTLYRFDKDSTTDADGLAVLEANGGGRWLPAVQGQIIDRVLESGPPALLDLAPTDSGSILTPTPVRTVEGGTLLVTASISGMELGIDGANPVATLLSTITVRDPSNNVIGGDSIVQAAPNGAAMTRASLAHTTQLSSALVTGLSTVEWAVQNQAGSGTAAVIISALTATLNVISFA